MRYTILFIFCFASFWGLTAQETQDPRRSKTLAVKDTIVVDTVSISSTNFKVLNLNDEEISAENYTVDYGKGILILKNSVEADSVKVNYQKYPDFLTKRYYQFDPSVITNGSLNQRIYALENKKTESNFTPFEGLNTSGSISRGITTGTNQNTVLDSELDLQISGNISPNVGLRASIQDSNIPVQEAGYSQNLDEFDQVFIELYGKNWSIRAGDVDLVQDNSYFASYTKKVQGLSVTTRLNPEGNSTQLYAAGALVRGVFTRNQFQGQEGNQGPYKLNGPNGGLYVFIVSGSEAVFVNGVQLQRGENEDYIIDYNAGELIFNPTFPITSEMRITVEFQYSERNYSRVVATAGSNYNSEKLQLGGFLYTENDLKNQPLQQNLSEEQTQVLADAGDDTEEMVAPSAVPDTFDENKVLYRKETINGEEIFVYSTDPDDDLFNVRFSLVGANQGDYILVNANAISKIYEYVPPVNGVPQGNYAPVTRLFAPKKLQVAVVNGGYTPTEKTQVNFEVAGSKNDQNLFSELDDEDNDGFAGRLQMKQTLTSSENNQLNAFGTFNFIQKYFQTIERLYNVEFNRDWNLVNPLGNQSYLDTGVEFNSKNHGTARYSFQKLDYSENYSGARQLIQANLKFGKLRVQNKTSFLTSNGSNFDSEFFRLYTNAAYSFPKNWIGTRLSFEDNQQTDKATEELTGISQKFGSYEVYTGVGDSTNVYAEVGYRHRVNDSLRNNRLQRVNTSDNYYLKSQLVNSETTKLSVFANYRILKNEEEGVEDERSLNSRIMYNQFLFNRILNLNTLYETNSGTLPRQEFTYVEVNAGEGQYTWNDYNDNGVQELEEFEIAAFPDEAKYVRVLLPNQLFLKTHQNKFSQIVTLNFQQWNTEDGGIKKLLSHFYNQTSYIIDRKIERDGDNFDLNPFNDSGEELGANLNLRNTLFYNRGKQLYTTSYTYLTNRNKNLLATGLIESDLESHQLNFNHKIQESWLVTLKGELNTNESQAENFENRDFTIDSYLINPKLSYLLSQSTRFDIFYQLQEKENLQGENEFLRQNKYGASFTVNNAQKFNITGEFNYIYNEFEGNTFSPVAYQMLQGLQPEKNYTWTLLAQKKLTNYLDLNLSYFGRKSESSNTIHTGSVQLRAYF